MISKNVLFAFSIKKKLQKMHVTESFICNNAAHDVILCNLGYFV